MTLKYYFITIMFILGIFFIINNANGGKFEGFANNCPDLLIKKGGSFYLLNTQKPTVPGVNPIQFNTLNEYVQFIEWQRKQGVRCPVLYFQQTSDAQGSTSYRMLPDPRNPNVGLSVESIPFIDDERYRKLVDASRTGPIFNRGSYPGYDPNNQDIGIETPLDKLYTSTGSTSDNPMDPNWGGVEYSRDVVKSGKYADSEVKIRVA